MMLHSCSPMYCYMMLIALRDCVLRTDIIFCTCTRKQRILLRIYVIMLISPDKMACSNCKHCFQQVAVVTVSIAFTRLLWYHKVVNLLAKASLIHIVICRFISFLEERTSISCSMHTFAPGIDIQLQQWQMNKHIGQSHCSCYVW